MSLDTYWNTPRAYYVSAAFLFAFTIFMVCWVVLLPDFWNNLDPLFSFVGIVGIIASASLGVLMVYLGWNTGTHQRQN